MALLTREDLLAAITRLGELAVADKGPPVELLMVGGGVMLLEFRARHATRDVDAVVTNPADAPRVRAYAAVVAAERGWQPDWLNDGAKGFLSEPINATLLFESPGVRLGRPAIEQLLAMKLSAWRDDLDITDAARLLEAMTGDPDHIWRLVVPYVQPGRELTAKFAFEYLCEGRR